MSQETGVLSGPKIHLETANQVTCRCGSDDSEDIEFRRVGRGELRRPSHRLATLRVAEERHLVACRSLGEQLRSADRVEDLRPSLGPTM